VSVSSKISLSMSPHAPMIDLPDGLTLQRENGISTVTLARENPRNPLSHAIMSGLRDVARWLKTDIETHAVIVTGDPVFSAGADLKDPDMRTDHMPRLQQRQALLLGPDMCAAWEALEQVTICAIEGYCLGGGMALAVACDWRVCAEDAQLRLPEIPLGINMSWQANPRITALIGPSRAKQVIILGENIPATQAENWGLVDFVTGKGESLAKAQELAAKVVALPPLPVRMSKQAVNAHAYALNYASSFMDREQYALLTGSEENKDAIKAFINKSKSSDN